MNSSSSSNGNKEDNNDNNNENDDNDDDDNSDNGNDSNDDSSSTTSSTASPMTSTLQASPLLFKMSLKDLSFIRQTFQQLVDAQTNANNIPRRTLKERFLPSYLSFRDIGAVNVLTKVLVHVPLREGEVVSGGGAEMFVDLCDMSLTVRNNTYNFNIFRLDLSEMRVSYSRSLDSLHTAVGMRCALWSYR